MPDIRFYCAICGMGLHVASDYAGGAVECPACRRVVPVPVFLPPPHGSAGCVAAFPPDVLSIEIKFLCPTCESKLKIDARWEGRMRACPNCGGEVRVPQWSATTTPAAGSDTRPPAPLPSPRLSPAEIEFLSEPPDIAPQVAS